MPVWLFPLLCWSAGVVAVVLTGVLGVFVWFMGMVHTLDGIEFEDAGDGDE